MMVGTDEAIEYLENINDHRQDKELSEMGYRITNRIKYIRAKDTGKRPVLHKGIYGKKYDHYTCGNCACGLDIGYNYCHNCGYLILWDSPRCLTR